MRLNFATVGGGAEVILGARAIHAARERLEALRRQPGHRADAVAAPDWFLSRIVIGGDLPIVVLLYRRGEAPGTGEPYAAALLRGRRLCGIPTGVVRAGNLAGQGAVIAPPGEAEAVLEKAARVLLDRFLAHTVVVSRHLDGPPPEAGRWHVREARTRLSLAGGLEGFHQRLSRKFRRNFRYYRRRAEEGGCVFLPELTPEQSRAAVAAIQPHASFAVKASYARRLEAALRATPGSFSMALYDSGAREGGAREGGAREGGAGGKAEGGAGGDAGEAGWIGYLAGWRRPEATYVEWQLNRVDHAATSLSTVMRACLIEHEASRGVAEIVFIGGAAELWSRVCEEAWCADLVLTRKGIAGALTRALTCRLRPNGRLALLHRETAAASRKAEAAVSREAAASEREPA